MANLYYNQTILNRIADSFHVTFEKASSVATLMQAGYAVGLLLICPLGDLFRRRPFILGLIAFTASLVSFKENKNSCLNNRYCLNNILTADSGWASA